MRSSYCHSVKNILRSAAFLNFARLVASLSINGGVLYFGYKEGEKNYDWYLHLSPEEQRRVYNNCPEQKFSYPTDFFGSLGASHMTRYPDSLHINTPPVIPFEDSVARRSKKTSSQSNYLKNIRNILM